MPLGYLNCGFGKVLGKDWLDRIHDLGFAGIRTDVGIQWKSVVKELGEYNKLSPIFLFGGGNMSGWTKEDFLSYTSLIAKYIVKHNYFSGIPIYFEIGNEPDIAVREWRENPKELNNTFWECYQNTKSICSEIELITGGISNLISDRLTWLDQFLVDPLPKHAIVGFHRYPNGPDITKPHNGFPSREHEWNRLMSLVNGHRLFCTETGMSNGPHSVPRGFPLCWINKHIRISNQQQGEAIAHEWEFYRRKDVLGMVWYQLRDGRDTYKENFGIYTVKEQEKYSCDVLRKLNMRT